MSRLLVGGVMLYLKLKGNDNFVLTHAGLITQCIFTGLMHLIGAGNERVINVKFAGRAMSTLIISAAAVLD